MTREEIIKEILNVIDEVGACDGVNIANNYPINTLLDQAGREVLLIAPIGAIERSKSFKSAELLSRDDGSGTVTLPNDFVRLFRFRMRGWHKSVTETIATTSKKYAKQFHRATRGGVARPIVALLGDKIEYFSVLMDTTPVIEEAEYVYFTSVDEEFPSKLRNALIWLTAVMTLKVMGEYDAAKIATEEYERLLNSIYLNYGK